MENKRREFIKKTAVVASSLAIGSTAANAGAFGDNNNIPNGDKNTYSTKDDIMYKKTDNWNKFYKAATYNRFEV